MKGAGVAAALIQLRAPFLNNAPLGDAGCKIIAPSQTTTTTGSMHTNQEKVTIIRHRNC
jgi:hypothetical protein